MTLATGMFYHKIINMCVSVLIEEFGAKFTTPHCFKSYDLTQKVRELQCIRQERLASDKRSSLLKPCVSCKENEVL